MGLLAPPSWSVAAARAGVLVSAPAYAPAATPRGMPSTSPSTRAATPHAARPALTVATAPTWWRRAAKNDAPLAMPTQ